MDFKVSVEGIDRGLKVLIVQGDTQLQFLQGAIEKAKNCTINAIRRQRDPSAHLYCRDAGGFNETNLKNKGLPASTGSAARYVRVQYGRSSQYVQFAAMSAESMLKQAIHKHKAPIARIEVKEVTNKWSNIFYGGYFESANLKIFFNR